MALCINDSGTWRNITTQCINDSNTWRKVRLGQVNDSGTWRTYRDCRCVGCCSFSTSCALGSCLEGGNLICKSSSIAWIVSPSSSCVARSWYSRNDAITRAQQVTECTGWFIPTCDQLNNPGWTCRDYWDAWKITSGPGQYWSSTEAPSPGANYNHAWTAGFPSYSANQFGGLRTFKLECNRGVRAFRCVTY